MLACLLSGCFESSPFQDAETVATAYCNCLVTPSMLDGCVEDILDDLPPVSDACLDCVFQNSQTCSTLFNDCTALCDNSATPLLGGM